MSTTYLIMITRKPKYKLMIIKDKHTIKATNLKP